MEHSNKNSLATPLAKVKGLGSARSGTEHFIRQRMTAIFMLLTLVWLINLMLDIATEPVSLRGIIFGSILNSAMAVFFVGNFLYHGCLGLQVIIEDYVHCKFKFAIMLIALRAFCIITFISFAMIGVATMDSLISLTIISRLLQGLN